jgi:hypothetical protein
MIKLFGGKPDHPMADPKEARRILDQLPAQDPFKSLDELTHWLESVSAVEGLKPEARIQVLLMIDEAAQPRLRKLTKDYLAAERPSRFQENRLWTALHGYCRQAGLSFARMVDEFTQGVKGVEAAKAQLALLLVRALRSLAQQIKWMHMRYGPIDLSIWNVFHRVYAYAELRQLAQAKVSVYPGITGSGESTPQLEFLKGVMFSAGSPDSLLPIEVELAERIIAEYAPRFTIAPAPAPEHVFWTDLAQAMSPLRVTRTPPTGPGLRCFGPGGSVPELNELIERIYTSGQVPAGVNLGGSYEPEVALEVLRHLALVWSPQPPERKAQRHAVKSRLSVAHGYDGVLGALGSADSLSFDAQGSESWIVENVSAGGFGTVVPQLKGDWLRVGALVALQPEGGTNWLLGLVRRVNKTGQQQARVGIETLSKTPEVSRFGVSGSQSAEQGVLLKNADAVEARIVLKPGVFAPMQNLEVQRGARQHVYIPQGLAERGEDYEIARFREMIRES